MTSHRDRPPGTTVRRRIAVFLIVVAAALPFGSAPRLRAEDAFPEGPPDPTPERGLTQPIDVDLATNPLKQFGVRGPVTWQPGKLALESGGKLLREVELGAEVKL